MPVARATQEQAAELRERWPDLSTADGKVRKDVRQALRNEGK